MKFEQFEKHAESLIDIVHKEMPKFLNVFSIAIKNKKIEEDDSISFILDITFSLPNVLQHKLVHLSISYDNPDKILFRGKQFNCPQELDLLFQYIKEQVLH